MPPKDNRYKIIVRIIIYFFSYGVLFKINVFYLLIIAVLYQTLSEYVYHEMISNTLLSIFQKINVCFHHQCYE